MVCKGISVKKQPLGKMARCYTVADVVIDGKTYFLFASDGRDGQLIGYYGEKFQEKEVILANVGGCMSIKQIPGKSNELLVLCDFYLGDSPSFAKVIWLKKIDNQWLQKDLFHLPFTHRLDCVEIGGNIVVLLATIADFKTDKADWRFPGAVYGFQLPQDFYANFSITLTTIATGLTKNHGYYRDFDNQIFFGCEEGVFRLNKESANIAEWTLQIICDEPTSDLIYGDFDGDDQAELLIITPFHGNQLKLLKADSTGMFTQTVFEYDEDCEIIHGLAWIKNETRNQLVIGVRKGAAALLAICYEAGAYRTSILDQGMGPINLTYNQSQEVLVVANHTADEATLYWLEAEPNQNQQTEVIL